MQDKQRNKRRKACILRLIKTKKKMKANDFGHLAAKVITALNANECKPVKTDTAYSWQNFTPLSDKEAEMLNGFDVSGCVYQGGRTVQIVITVELDGDKASKAEEARKTLKAKNLCLMAVEAKVESQQKAQEADELLTQAAAQLGIPVEDVEKIVVTETEEEE